jgi:hypothetical protein
MKQTEHCRCAADVIGICVCEDERVEAADAERPKRTCYDALAYVEARTVTRVVGLKRGDRQAAGIDQYASPAGEQQRRGITLPHIQKDHPHRPRWRSREIIARGGHHAADHAHGGANADGHRNPPHSPEDQGGCH